MLPPLRYFHATAWLLDSDPSIYCINSFSLNSFPSVAADATRLRRAEVFPQFGWMVSRDWAEQILPMWVPNTVSYFNNKILYKLINIQLCWYEIYLHFINKFALAFSID